jgi:hypothetical protein
MKKEVIFMSDIKKCDRCGNAYDPYATLKTGLLDGDWWRYLVYKDCHPYETIKIDLCPLCKKELFNWIENKKEVTGYDKI